MAKKNKKINNGMFIVLPISDEFIDFIISQVSKVDWNKVTKIGLKNGWVVKGLKNSITKHK